MNKSVVMAATVVLVSFPTASFAGLTFKMVTTENGKTANEMQVWVEGSSMKSQVLTAQSNNPIMPPGSYMLMTEQGMFLVDPQARQFTRFDMSMLEGMTQAITDSGLADTFEITNVNVEQTLDEAGESIEGYATRHYQFKSSWTMQIVGSPMTTNFSSVEDIWATDQLTLPTAGGMAFDQSALPPSVKEFAAAQGLRNIAGFPLRTVTQQTTQTNMGMSGLGGRMAQRMMNRAMGSAGADDTTTTLDARDFATIEIPADTFVVPADYMEVQLFQTGPDVPDLNNLPSGPATQLPEVPNLDEIQN